MSDREQLRGALLRHHPIMRSETGPFSGCRCGQVGLGEDVIAHVVEHLSASRRCPEAIIRSKPEDVSLVVTQCGRDGGHDGNHYATTERGSAEWPRIKNQPRQWPDELAPF